jgi:predicted DNA-binding protein
MTSRRASPFPLRMSDGMRARLDELAKSNGRSTNAELLAILEAAIRAKDSPDVVSANELLVEVARSVAAAPAENLGGEQGPADPEGSEEK